MNGSQSKWRLQSEKPVCYAECDLFIQRDGNSWEEGSRHGLTCVLEATLPAAARMLWRVEYERRLEAVATNTKSSDGTA